MVPFDLPGFRDWTKAHRFDAILKSVRSVVIEPHVDNRRSIYRTNAPRRHRRYQKRYGRNLPGLPIGLECRAHRRSSNNVLFEGRHVGRIYKVISHAPREAPWF